MADRWRWEEVCSPQVLHMHLILLLHLHLHLLLHLHLHLLLHLLLLLHPHQTEGGASCRRR